MKNLSKFAGQTKPHGKEPPNPVLLNSFAQMANGDPDCLNVAHNIMAQMGLGRNLYPGIRSAWAVRGTHNAGGLLLVLEPDSTQGNGDIFAVSYNLRDDYTITYAKREPNLCEDEPEQVAIIKESEEIYCDQLCEIFTRTTGITIPTVQFG